jgi:hypothetical protein
MSQLLRNLMTRSVLAKRVLTHELSYSFQQNQLSKFIQTYRNQQHLPLPLLNAISFKHYVTNTYPNSSAYPKQKRNIDPIDEFSKEGRSGPRKFGQHYVKDYNRSNSQGYSRPKPRQMNREYDSESFKDAEQVESSGKASDYGTTETQDFSKYNLPAELVDRMKELGFTKPFEIQEATLKHSLEGR